MNIRMRKGLLTGRDGGRWNEAERDGLNAKLDEVPEIKRHTRSENYRMCIKGTLSLVLFQLSPTIGCQECQNGSFEKGTDSFRIYLCTRRVNTKR